MKIGVICSSGGSTFKEVFGAASRCGWHKNDFLTLSDRECGFKKFCLEEGIPHHFVDDSDNMGFSKKAAELLAGVDATLLFFSRLVTKEFFDHVPTFNIHPSLLPAFTGFGAIKRAKEGGSRFLGATLHRVNESVDMGPIVAQVCSSVDPGWELRQFEKLSFVQRVYLGMVFLEQTQGKKNSALKPGASPALIGEQFQNAIETIQKKEGVQAFS